MTPLIATRDDFTSLLVRFVDDAEDVGVAAIRAAIGSSLKRHLARSTTLPAALFDDHEILTLTNAFAGPLAVSSLLGRARIRQSFIDVSSGKVNVETFNEPATTGFGVDWLLSLVTPQSAIDYFRRLIPISIGDDLFGSLITGQAFSLAATTSTTIRRQIAKVIDERLETGKQVRATGQEVNEILDEAGIPHKKGYGQMVSRTNMMEAYRHGSWDEFQDPDIAAFFPVWQYSGIPDGRERMGPMPEKPDHHRWFGKYFPRERDFFSVRGLEAKDVINCRCNWIGINRYRWARLQKQGAKLAA